MKNILLTLVIVCSAVLFSNTQAHGQKMDEDVATLVVYRDGFLYGAWKDFDVVIDGEKMAELKKNKSIQTFRLAPGSHRIAPKKDKKAIDINMAGGSTYVVEYKVRFGLLGAVPKLDIKTVAEAKDDSKLVREHLKKEMMMEEEMMEDQ